MPEFTKRSKEGSLADRYLLNRRGRMLLQEITGNLPNEPAEEIAKYLATDERNVYQTRVPKRIRDLSGGC